MAEPNGITSESLIGFWESEPGQSVKIRKWPVLGLRVSYKPVRGRTRTLKVAEVQPDKINLYLSWLGPLEAMLYLKLVRDPETKEAHLVPEIKSGPESQWDRGDFGYPWLFPLKEFHRASP